MMNDVVSDPVGTFMRLATPPPDINGPPSYKKDASKSFRAVTVFFILPTPLPEGCFKAAFGGMRKVKFFYETLSVQSWPEASERHFDVKNL